MIWQTRSLHKKIISKNWSRSWKKSQTINKIELENFTFLISFIVQTTSLVGFEKFKSKRGQPFCLFSSIHMSVRLSAIHVSVRLYVRNTFCLFICPYISVCSSVCLSFCLNMQIFAHLMVLWYRNWKRRHYTWWIIFK